MKDKLISLENGQAVCVIDELNYENKKYILTAECDKEKEKIVNRYKIYEVILEDSNITLNTVIAKNILEAVTQIFLKNIKNI